MATFNNPLSSSIIIMFFFVSTMFGLMHYWNEASNINDELTLEEKNADQIIVPEDNSLFGSITGIFSSGFLDYMLNALSWLSPFALVKGTILIFTVESPEIYTFVDYFLLRPMGWIMFFIQFEWVAFLVRGKGN